MRHVGIAPPPVRPRTARRAFTLADVWKIVGIAVAGLVGIWFVARIIDVLLGVFAALTEAIPLVGPYIGGLPAVLLALSISPLRATLVILTYVIVQQFESNTLVPLVIGRTVGLNPLVTLLAVLIGAVLYGIPGALLAVPIMALCQVIFLRLIVPLLRGELRLNDDDDPALSANGYDE